MNPFKEINYRLHQDNVSSRVCLRADKPRQFLKNWRPISLLNVTYKLISSVIATRLKKVMDRIISKTQTGFLTDRFIGESTRLIYDIMKHTEDENIKGLLMLIDFEKAFDSISWNFLYKCFNFYNFGDNIIKWVKLLNTEITASVQQCGFLSESFEVHRGCRQGDPIASLEFLLPVQFMFLMIIANKDIKGINIKGKEYKMTQFADDTTMILDGTQKSLQMSLNTIEIFGSYSGLKMNKEKTHIIWIGRNRATKEKLETNPTLHWGEVEFDLLGIKYHTNLNKMMELNYSKYIKQAEQVIKHWNRRQLTPMGKITVIKTFIMSKFIHIFTSLPTPKEDKLKEINKMLYLFLWDNKTDKIKRERITQNYNNGGLKMVNIKHFITALKVSWVRRLISSSNQPWSTLFNDIIGNKINLIEYGPDYLKTLKTKNLFWKSTFQAYTDYCKKYKPLSITHKLQSPIWYNPEISIETLHQPIWYSKGISKVGDILDTNYEILTTDEIKRKFKIKKIDFLTYHRIKTLVKTFLQINQEDTTPTEQYQRPSIPYYYIPIRIANNGIRPIYNILNRNENIEMGNKKWDRDLQITIDKTTWITSYNICFRTVEDNYLIWFQHRILNTEY